MNFICKLFCKKRYEPHFPQYESDLRNNTLCRILTSFGETVALSPCNAQDTAAILYKEGDQYGYLPFGHVSLFDKKGSLKKIKNIEDMKEYMDVLKGCIQWYTSATKCLYRHWEYIRMLPSWAVDDTLGLCSDGISNYLLEIAQEGIFRGKSARKPE
jgi:hypothetical protein